LNLLSACISGPQALRKGDCMTTSKLTARPSLESLRKQAKKLARRIAAGDAAAIARARAQLSQAGLPLSQRDAQLVLAREYGFPGWKDLLKEVKQRLGRGLEWAVSEARRIIHENDIEGLRQLLAEYPALLLWRGASWNSPEAGGRGEDDRGLLGMATGSFGDSFDPNREQHFTRRECAELLLDAGAVVAPSVCDGLIDSRAKGLIDLFHRKGLLPRSLKFFAALGDVDGVCACLDTNAVDLAVVNEAFMYACHLQHATAAALLLDRSIAHDAELGRRIDGGPGRSAFIQHFIENKPDVHDPDPFGPWQAFVEQQVMRAMVDGDLAAFVDRLRREAWLLSDAHVKFQVRLIEGTAAALNDREAFLKALLDLDPAVLHSPVPPPSRVFVHAFTYAQTHLLPMLLRIWPMPDDLPHAAGNGDHVRVRRWFEAAGRPVLGDLANHFPANDAWIRGNLNWGEPSVQQVLDTALAWAVMNNHLEIADFLLVHGADINTYWSSHEPASILHELVWHKNYEAMQFLIDRGIDMTIVDYRWGGTAQGWAYHAAKDEKMAQWLAKAQQRQEQASN
jgi:ankyrin repeat protein